jgi:hypothetical protein
MTSGRDGTVEGQDDRIVPLLGVPARMRRRQSREHPVSFGMHRRKRELGLQCSGQACLS